MKKYLLLILLLLFVSTPVYAGCGDHEARVSLYSNNILDGYRFYYFRNLGSECPPGLIVYGCDGARQVISSRYGVSTFEVRFTDKLSTYYGYCIDPGYNWTSGDQTVCCDKLNTYTTNAIQSGFVYLLQIAGNLHLGNDKDSQEVIPIDLAIRLYAMVNGLSKSSYGGTGTGMYQLSTYLSKYIQVDFTAQSLYPRDLPRQKDYIRQKMRDSGFEGYTIDSFLKGANSSAYLSQAYTYLKTAMQIKNNYSGSTVGGTPGTTGSLVEFDPSTVSCDSNYIKIAVEKSPKVENLSFAINGQLGVPTRYINGSLYIDKGALLNTASCDSGDIVVQIETTYTSSSSIDPAVYLCHANSGSRMQQIITYDGQEGLSTVEEQTYTNITTIVIPNTCVGDDEITCRGDSGGRCTSSGEVQIMSSINNCCYDPYEGNTSTVSDMMSYQNIDQPLDLDELFAKDPKLKDDELKSLVKCGTQEMTSAPDFQARTENATTEVMNSVCQMYCMERTKIITPPPVTVTAGRYFELDFTKMDIQGHRRCRISVDLATVFKKYVNIVRSEISGFDGYYYNRAHELLYKTLWENGFEGVHHFNKEIKIPIRCKRVAGSAYCQGDGLNIRPIAFPLHCTGGVQQGKYLYNRNCVVEVEALTFGPGLTQHYPYLRASLNHDLGQNGKMTIYNQPDTFIRAEAEFAGYANFKKTLNSDRLKQGYFVVKTISSTCQNLKAAAGNPECWCPDGQPARAQINWYEMVDKCYCNGVESALSKCRTAPVPEGCDISNVRVDHTWDNFYVTGSGKAFSCEIDPKGVDLINYISSPGRGYYPNFYDEYQAYEQAAQYSYNQYLSALNELKILEASFRECIDFFSDGYGSQSFEEHYDVSKIKTSFEYDQVFSTTAGATQTSTTQGKIGHNCEVTLAVGQTPGHDPAFEKTNVGVIRLEGLHRETLPYDVGSINDWVYPGSSAPFAYYMAYDEKDKNMNNGPFEKKVTIDAVYTVTCEFKDEGNDYYTLVPGGHSAPTTSGGNFVTHEKLMSTHLTTYAGKHEILYHITGLGSQIMRQFDRYFQTGVTCSGRNSGDYLAPASCYIDVKQKLVTTGTCDEVASATTYDTACEVTCAGDGNCSSIYNFVFKMADETDLFPTGLSDSSDWGKNWLTTEGRTTRSKIEDDGKKSKTYAPEKLTYSYMLTPKTIEAIKKYNMYQIDSGGYNDFGLSCDCGGGTHACVHCQSKFLSELAQTNSINSVNVSYVSPVKLWTNSKTIQEVRNANHNWDKDTTATRAILH